MKDNQHRIVCGFGIDEVATKILRLLADATISHRNLLKIENSPFYNGREKHVAISVIKWRPFMRTMIITFGENRNSDDIVIQSLVQDSDINPPCIHNRPKDTADKSYRNRAYLEQGQEERAAREIISKINEYLADGDTEGFKYADNEDPT